MQQNSSEEKLLEIAAQVEKSAVTEDFKMLVSYLLEKVRSREGVKLEELIIDNIFSGAQIVSLTLKDFPGNLFINNIFPGHYDLYIGDSFKESLFAATVVMGMNKDSHVPGNVNIHIKENWHQPFNNLSNENILYFRKIIAELFQDSFQEEQIIKEDRNLHSFRYFKTDDELKAFHSAPPGLLNYFEKNKIESWSEESDELILIADAGNNQAVEIFRRLEKMAEKSGYLAIINRHTKLRLRGIQVRDNELCLELYSPETLSKLSLQDFWNELYLQLENYTDLTSEQLLNKAA